MHVVGGQVFCTRVDSEATDYRYASREGVAADMHADRLPDDIAPALCAACQPAWGWSWPASISNAGRMESLCASK